MYDYKVKTRICRWFIKCLSLP